MACKEEVDQLKLELDEAVARIAELQVNNQVDVTRLSRLTGFYNEDPSLWFIQVEAAFANARITSDRTKANHVISELGPEVIVCIRDLITEDPRPDDLYGKIKARIISHFSVSSEARLRQLLKGDVSSAGKPSQILSRLNNLNDNRCGTDIIRSIFLDQLPVQHRAILVASQIKELSDLAIMADKIFESVELTTVNVASTKVENLHTFNLEEKIDMLTAKIASLERKSDRSRARGPTERSRSNSKHRSRSKSTNSNGRCFYHSKFGKNAKKCREPCSWIDYSEKNKKSDSEN
ncbi:uncharacterized protein LOC122499954 [Leptopilina heterotoma]|uniref:uncharacterized protein LOC122499954 n=1 Tax=Leptopilina heterotoma TaxID=63436 RepID=UPI001CA8F6F9|nr:uncharacterized protein LOC122499954 [Leptopilina heterotoma]